MLLLILLSPYCGQNLTDKEDLKFNFYMYDMLCIYQAFEVVVAITDGGPDNFIGPKTGTTTV